MLMTGVRNLFYQNIRKGCQNSLFNTLKLENKNFEIAFLPLTGIQFRVLLPFRLGRAEMKPRRKLDLLTCQGKNFCALLFSSRFLSSLHSLPFQSPLVSTVFFRWYLRFLPHCYSRINSVCSPNHYLLGCRGCRGRTLFVSFLVLSFLVFANKILFALQVYMPTSFDKSFGQQEVNKHLVHFSFWDTSGTHKKLLASQ